jgi:flavodoxin
MNDRKDGKRVLVAYYSLTGSTARVARDLAARLNACDSSIPPGRTR